MPPDGSSAFIQNRACRGEVLVVDTPQEPSKVLALLEREGVEHSEVLDALGDGGQAQVGFDPPGKIDVAVPEVVARPHSLAGGPDSLVVRWVSVGNCTEFLGQGDGEIKGELAQEQIGPQMALDVLPRLRLHRSFKSERRLEEPEDLSLATGDLLDPDCAILPTQHPCDHVHGRLCLKRLPDERPALPRFEAVQERNRRPALGEQAIDLQDMLGHRLASQGLQELRLAIPESGARKGEHLEGVTLSCLRHPASQTRKIDEHVRPSLRVVGRFVQLSEPLAKLSGVRAQFSIPR